MHRSGTSALAGSMSLLGANMGDNLLQPQPENPKGFFESHAVMNAHDEALEILGFTWDDPRPIDFASVSTSQRYRCRQLLLDAAVAQIAGASGVSVIKDPRCSRLVPIWVEVFQELELQPRFVLSLRTAAEAAASLQRRSSASLAVGFELWRQHVLAMERHSRGFRRSIVAFDQLLRDPVGVLEVVESDLEIAFPAAPVANRSALESFLEPALAHGAVDQAEHIASPEWAEQIERDLRSLSKKANNAATKRLDGEGVKDRLEPRHAAEHATQLHFRLKGLAESNKSGTASAADFAEAISRIESAERVTNALGRSNAQLMGTLDGLRKEFARVVAERAGSSDARTDGLADDVEGLRQQNSTVRNELVELRRELLSGERVGVELEQAGREELAKRDESIASLALENEKLAMRLLALESSIGDANATRTDLNSRLGALESASGEQLTAASVLFAEWQEARSAIVTRVDELAAELEATKQQSSTEQQLEALSVRLDALESSISAEDVRLLAEQSAHAVSTVRLEEMIARLEDVVAKSAVSYNNELRRVLDLSARTADVEELRARVDEFASQPPSIEQMVPVVSNNGGDAGSVPAGSEDRLPAFESCADPLVSVIIPAFNHTEVTLSCLRSIEQHLPTVPFEVIVGNDCSTAADFERVRSVAGIEVADMPVNSGFGHNCNNAASKARGEFLYFLNNDTQITEGAIDNLVETFEMFPQTGIAGSKLIFPDGTVQDAGGIVWNDGSAWNYGRGKAPDTPELDYCRVADYVAGASLMIRKDLFDELGGFDDLYAPAYYEDTDLCMKVRQRGLEVRYQAKSEVVHNEGTSYGTDVNQEGKHNQVINREKFLDRWMPTLSHHRPNGELPELEKERGIDKRILVIDARMLTPDRDAGSLRMVNICLILMSMGYKVTFIPKNLLEMEPYDDALMKNGIEVLTRKHISNIPDFLAARGEEFDVVMMSRVEVVKEHLDTVRSTCPWARVVFDTVDLHFLRERRELEVTGSSTLDTPFSQTYLDEMAAIDGCDATLVCSLAEQDLIAEEKPAAQVQWVSTVHREAVSVVRPEDRSGLLFVGGFEHPPNRDGITWFANEVFPKVLAERPDEVLHIIGSKTPDEVWDLESPNIRVHGFVEDLTPFYDSCRAAVAPIRFGAGVKGKVTQAMGRGLPVIATQIAVEGMPGAPNEYAFVGDEEDALALCSISALRDIEHWSARRDAALAVVDSYYSFEAIAQQLAEMLTAKGDESNAHRS